MKRKRILEKYYKKTYFIVFTALIITILTVLLFKTSFFQLLELKTLDYRFRKSSSYASAKNDIIIVSIDDNSLKFFNKNGVSWPWPRDFYAILCDYITGDGGKNILFDILFYEPDIDREETDSEYTDGKFAQSIKKNKNVILAAKLLKNKNKFDLQKRFKIFIKRKFKSENKYKGIILPLQKFLNYANGIGIINVIPDKDGVIRRVPFLHRLNDFYLPQMGITPFLKEKINFMQKKFYISDIVIPMDEKENYFVNWYKPGFFKYVTFSSVIQSAFSKGGASTLPKGFFKDKIVLVGSTASGIDDYITTPFAKPVPGVELWATIISNIKNREFVKNAPFYITFLLLFVFVFSTVFVFLRFHNKLFYFLIAILPVAYIYLTFFVFDKYRLILPLVSMIFAISVSFLYSSLMGYFAEGKSKRELKKVFSRYLHPDVVEELVNNPYEIKLGGDTIFATVFFSDIANFTTYSEGKTAEEVITVLNRYFKSFSDFILGNRGLLDKYMGDGIMAIFGAPFQIEEHAILACKTALQHKFFADNVNNEAEFLHKNTRIGINSGYIVAGNLGSEKKTEYTAIGDDVNLGSRLEGVNKIYKTKIIISKATYDLVKEHFVCRELDKLKVKGKSKATSIYELIDYKKNKEKYPWIKYYERGLQEYRKANWKEAIKSFNKVIDLHKDDYPSQLMIERCKKLMVENPIDWDGVITLKTK